MAELLRSWGECAWTARDVAPALPMPLRPLPRRAPANVPAPRAARALPVWARGTILTSILLGLLALELFVWLPLIS